MILTVLQYVLRRVRVKKDVRHAKTSVLVAGERKKGAKILVPVEGLKGSGKALRQAVSVPFTRFLKTDQARLKECLSVQELKKSEKAEQIESGRQFPM